jgi:hypothetical protein
MPNILDHASGPTLELSEEAWREIESTIGLREPSPLLRERLASYLRWYCDNSSTGGPHLAPNLLPPIVRRRHMEEALSKFAGLAANLADLLEDKNSKAPLESPEHWAEKLSAGLLSIQDRKALVTTLRDIDAQAKDAIGQLPADKGGPSGDANFIAIVSALADLYEHLTGETPGVSQSPLGEYGGPFFRFVNAAFLHLPPRKRRKRTNVALGKAIQRVLKGRVEIR